MHRTRLKCLVTLECFALAATDLLHYLRTRSRQQDCVNVSWCEINISDTRLETLVEALVHGWSVLPDGQHHTPRFVTCFKIQNESCKVNPVSELRP